MMACEYDEANDLAAQLALVVVADLKVRLTRVATSVSASYHLHASLCSAIIGMQSSQPCTVWLNASSAMCILPRPH